MRERGGKGRSADLVQLEEDNVGGDVWTTAKRHRLARARSAAHAARGEWDLNFALCWRGCGSMGCGGSRIGPQPDKASAKAPPPSFTKLFAAGTVVPDERDVYVTALLFML